MLGARYQVPGVIFFFYKVVELVGVGPVINGANLSNYYTTGVLWSKINPRLRIQ